MRRLLSTLFKFFLGYSGPVLVVVHVLLFRHFFSEGMQTPVASRVVILNNHGVNRYSTAQQDLALDLSLLAAAIMMIAFFATIIVKIRKRH